MLEVLYKALVILGAFVLLLIAIVIVAILERRREEPSDGDRPRQSGEDDKKAEP